MPVADRLAGAAQASPREAARDVSDPDFAGIASEAPKPPSRRPFSNLRRRLADSREDPELAKDPEVRARLWQFDLKIDRLQNLYGQKVNVFFAVSVDHVEPKKFPSQVRLARKYTEVFALDKNEKVLEQPLIMYQRKNFQLSYKDLEKHAIKVDMWTVSSWTFNEYFGVGRETLAKVATRTPDSTLMLRRKLTKKQQEEQKKKRSMVPHVANFGCAVSVEEIFSYTLSVENFKLTLGGKEKDSRRRLVKHERPHRLRFQMPKNRKSLPGTNMIGSRSHTSKLLPADNAATKFWANCGDYEFVGTRTHLQNSYFLITVYGPAPPAVPAAVASNKVTPLGEYIGECLMNLTSVLDASVFEGKVKKFFTLREDEGSAEQNRKRYIQGEICGYIKVSSRSRTLNFDEMDYRGVRPMQPKTTTTVSHLNKKERHLVVVVDKCQGLPVADIEEGSSDPYLRVSWDNMVAVSSVMKETLKPVFKYRCYFPVRMAGKMPRTRDGERKHRGILKMELESKGPMKIEVFDDDDTSADMLGSCYVQMYSILNESKSDARTLIGGAAKKEEHVVVDGDSGARQIGQWYTTEKEVRVFDGARTPLSQTALRNEQSAICSFEAYFYPDFDEDLRLDQIKEGDKGRTWEKEKAEWFSEHEKFRATYERVFPEAIGAWKGDEESVGKANFRIFSCLSHHPLTGEMVPLMSFLSPIIVPEDEGMPAKLLHWMHCLSFETSAQHVRTGRIPRQSWHDPEYVLARRKGTVWDHAILLCSLLLGCKKDAYVCKGMVKRQQQSDKFAQGANEYIEHVWVMTRYHGWVTFWEPTTGQSYHLPDRYSSKSKRTSGHSTASRKVPARKDDSSEAKSPPAEEEDGGEEIQVAPIRPMEHFSHEVEDRFLGAEDVSNLPVLDRRPRAKQKSTSGRSRQVGPALEQDHGKSQEWRDTRQEEERKKLGKPFWPKSEMLVQGKTLVYWLPYESIDVVFNNENLWANHQNHHPACITYDMDDGEGAGWVPFLRWDYEEGGGEDDKPEVEPIARQIKVMPPMKPDQLDNLQKKLRDELIQNLLLYRLSKGMDTNFHEPPELLSQIHLFLEIQDLWLQVDPDFVKKCSDGERFHTDFTSMASQDEVDSSSGTELESDREEERDKPADGRRDSRAPRMLRPMGTRNLASLGQHLEGVQGFVLGSDEQDPEAEKRTERVHNFIRHTLKPRYCNELNSPYFEETGSSFGSYAEQQNKLLEEIEGKIAEFLEVKNDKWGLKRGMKFEGFPVHFSTPDPDTIRQYLMTVDDYKGYIEDKDDDIYYTIGCLMRPLPGAILSVWLYIGIQKPSNSGGRHEQ